MWFIMALILGATTRARVEIITEALAFGLMVMAVEIIGAGAYFRWRKSKG